MSTDVDWLCVFFLSEAYSLRAAMITKPILVMGMIDTDLGTAAHQNIAFMTGDKEIMLELDAAGVLHRYRFAIHLKIDTGLSRFGIFPHEAQDMIAWIATLPGVYLAGVASHCAESQAPDQTFTQYQMTQLQELYRHHYALHDSQKILCHIGNSAIASQYPHALHSLFRVGIGTYGYWASAEIQEEVQHNNPWFTLQPVLTWKTTILTIKTVPQDTTVGYNRTFTTRRTTTLAVLPVGYLDGYSPSLSNKGLVKIENNYMPIVGRVAMNTIIVDITDYADVIHKGSIVTLIGDDPVVNASAIAAQTEFNNPRLILTSLHSAIPRYMKNALEIGKPSTQEHVAPNNKNAAVI